MHPTLKKFQSVPGIFFVTDTEGKILFANHALEQKTGFLLAEIIGEKPGNLWGGHMGKAFYTRMWHAIKTDKKTFSAKITNQNKHGQKYKETLYIEPILSKRGDIEYFMEMNPPLAHGDFTDFLHELSKEEDAKLLLEAKKNPTGYQKIFEKYRHAIHRYFLRRLPYDAQTSEDLTQETFLRALEYLENYHTREASYLTYLMRIAHNLLINHFRKKKPLRLEEKIMAGQSAKSFDTENNFIHFLKNLSSIEQKILQMRYEEDLTIHEISTYLNKSENAIKLHLSRARKKIKTFF